MNNVFEILFESKYSEKMKIIEDRKKAIEKAWKKNDYKLVNDILGVIDERFSLKKIESGKTGFNLIMLFAAESSNLMFLIDKTGIDEHKEFVAFINNLSYGKYGINTEDIIIFENIYDSLEEKLSEKNLDARKNYYVEYLVKIIDEKLEKVNMKTVIFDIGEDDYLITVFLKNEIEILKSDLEKFKIINFLKN